MTIDSRFGELLREHRKQSGYTQTEIVVSLRNQGYEERYSKSDISKWEHGRAKPPADVVEALEDILDLDRGRLLKAAGYHPEAQFISQSADESVKENIRQARQQHWNGLADMAAKAAEQFLGVYSWRAFDEAMWGRGAPKNPDAVKLFSNNVLDVLHPFEKGKFNDDRSWVRWNDLIAHIALEFKDFEKELKAWKECALSYDRAIIERDKSRLPEFEDRLFDLTAKLRKVFNRVAERRTFNGTCETCKDW